MITPASKQPAHRKAILLAVAYAVYAPWVKLPLIHRVDTQPPQARQCSEEKRAENKFPFACFAMKNVC